MSLEERVGQVEREQVRQGAELAAMRGQVTDVGLDVKKLLEREARRPTPLTFQVVAITCSSLAGIAAVVWWLIGNAPAVQDLTRRVDRLDDPIVGRVPTIERRIETITGWGPVAVVKGR